MFEEEYRTRVQEIGQILEELDGVVSEFSYREDQF